MVEEDLNGIIKRLEHLDVNMHLLMQQSEVISKQLEAITAELDAARPLIEKWQHSTIARLARGQMPWQQ